jgi:glycosyltransferase involved in cell wall biosynthesis
VKILFTSNRFHPDIGGIESISDILARSFVSAGHSLRLVTQSPGEAQRDQLIFPFPVVRRPSARELLACYRWADVVFQNNIEARLMWPLLLCRRPLLIALQTWLRSPEGKLTTLNRLKRLALLAADHVVSVSEAIRLDSFARSMVIGNPYKSQLFRPLPEIRRDKAIVFLGRLVSDKGVDLLLQAFAQLHPSGWRLTIIGDGPERCSNLPRILASDLPWPSWVHSRVSPWCVSSTGTS